jgi:SHS2 domain-containing protein
MQEAFAQVGLGVLALAVDPALVEEREARVVRAHGVEVTDLLVTWLNECFYVLDVEGFVARRIEFLSAALDPASKGGEPLQMHCLLHGEEMSADRHLSAKSLGGLDRQGAAVKEVDGIFEAMVIIRT